jgi:3-methyladenine DNA glycosylase/8-oxoguanine DNA glycosylase
MPLVSKTIRMKIFQYGQTEIDHLTLRDRKLGRAINRIGLIERQIIPDLFKALVHSVVAQQISRKAADTVYGRLCASLEEVTPGKVAGTDVSDIQQVWPFDAQSPIHQGNRRGRHPRRFGFGQN